MITKTLVLSVSLALCMVVPSERAAAASEDRVHEIESRFIAPCCWHENLAVHDSLIAREMRQQIEKLVASGKTESEIVDYYVAEYGERILRLSRGAPYWFLLITPFVVLGAGGIWVVHNLFGGVRPPLAETGS